MDLPELHVVVLGRREETDRYVDESEGDRAFPDGSHENKNAPMRPMLATPTPVIPSGHEWIHEVKWDGMRVLADVTEGSIRLTSRTERDVTVAFPELLPLATEYADMLRMARSSVSMQGSRPSGSLPSGSMSPTRGGRWCSPSAAPRP